MEQLSPFFKSSDPRNKSENPMVQLFYGTFLTEGVREGKLSALSVESRPVTMSVHDCVPLGGSIMKRLESQTNPGLHVGSASYYLCDRGQTM